MPYFLTSHQSSISERRRTPLQRTDLPPLLMLHVALRLSVCYGSDNQFYVLVEHYVCSSSFVKQKRVSVLNSMTTKPVLLSADTITMIKQRQGEMGC